MDAVTSLRGRMVPIPASNINTDTITPVRFLKMTGRDTERLAAAVFYDWRFAADGTPVRDFPLNQPQYQGATILIAGDNFGCGSSREKAPWALLAHGFRAIISTSIADIFRSNALKNGLLPVVVDGATHRELLQLVVRDPTAKVAIDLKAQTLRWGIDGEATFPIDAFSKTCLLQGVDQLGYLLRKEETIAEFERSSQGRSSA